MGMVDGKIAIITGATSGIGTRTVELFVEEGASVVFTGRRKGDELGRRRKPAGLLQDTLDAVGLTGAHEVGLLAGDEGFESILGGGEKAVKHTRWWCGERSGLPWSADEGLELSEPTARCLPKCRFIFAATIATSASRWLAVFRR